MYLASFQAMRQSGAGRTCDNQEQKELCDNQEQEELCDNQEQEEQKAVGELKEALVGDEVMSYKRELKSLLMQAPLVLVVYWYKKAKS